MSPILRCESHYQFTMTVCVGLLKVHSQTALMIEFCGDREEVRGRDMERQPHAEKHGAWGSKKCRKKKKVVIFLQRDHGCWSGNSRLLQDFKENCFVSTADEASCAALCLWKITGNTNIKRGCSMSAKYRNSMCVFFFCNLILKRTRVQMKTIGYTFTAVFADICVHGGGSILPVHQLNLFKCHLTGAATCASPPQSVR